VLVISHISNLGALIILSVRDRVSLPVAPLFQPLAVCRVLYCGHTAVVSKQREPNLVYSFVTKL